MALSLEKKTELVRLTLEKRNVLPNVVMQVKSVMDVSGSIKRMFDDGTIQELFDRLLAVANRFDDNQTLESFAFSDECVRLSDITPSQFGSYVSSTFIKEAQQHSDLLWGGTNYGAALETILTDMQPGKVSGFFKGLFGKKKEAPTSSNVPTYLLFVTDGDTSSESFAAKMLGDLADKNTFVQFIGVGNQSFSFLSEMDKLYSHVGFVTFPDLAHTSDQSMYEQLLTNKLATWINKS